MRYIHYAYHANLLMLFTTWNLA